MKNFMQMLKQAGELQSKIEEIDREMQALEVEGQSGGGMVKIRLNGKGAMKSVTIDPSLVKKGEGEILEDLIVAAFQDAKGKADASMQERMKVATAGLPIPPGLGKLF